MSEETVVRIVRNGLVRDEASPENKILTLEGKEYTVEEGGYYAGGGEDNYEEISDKFFENGEVVLMEWLKFKNCIFYNTRIFSEYNPIKNIVFENCIFYGAKFDSIHLQSSKFKYCIFRDNAQNLVTTFKGVVLDNSEFTDCSVEDTNPKISEGTALSFAASKFIKPVLLINFSNLKTHLLTEEQRKNAIFLEEQLRLYEENKQQKQTIEEIGKEQTKKLLSGFQTLKDDFGKEEENWFGGIRIIFIIDILLIILSFYCSFPSDIKIALGLLLVSLTYFSVHQYSKAKNLRIENQNKIALIHGYQAFQAKTDEDKDKKYKYFLPKFSDVIFTKAIPSKNEKNLPIDEIVKLKSLFKD